MNFRELAYDIQWKIDRTKDRLKHWYWNNVVFRIPTPPYDLYTSIDTEVIVTIYAFLVIIGPSLLSARGHVLIGIFTAVFGLSCAHLLRVGRRKRLNQELKDEVIEELEREGRLRI
jgi:hypothetical protein